MKTPTITYVHITKSISLPHFPLLPGSQSIRRTVHTHAWMQLPVNHKFGICMTTQRYYHQAQPWSNGRQGGQSLEYRKENYQLKFNRSDNKCPLQPNFWPTDGMKRIWSDSLGQFNPLLLLGWKFIGSSAGGNKFAD